MFFCKYCNKKLTSQKRWDNHLKTKLHANNLRIHNKFENIVVENKGQQFIYYFDPNIGEVSGPLNEKTMDSILELIKLYGKDLAVILHQLNHFPKE